MCYTGICPYENCTGSSDHIGECTLTCRLEDYPEDAGCIEALRKDEEDGNEHLPINK